MAYHITVMSPEGEISKFEYNEVPSLGMFRAWLDGHLEVVPYWEKFNGKKCVVFCNEEGKLERLPVNDYADHMWKMSLYPHTINDTLVGNVVIVQADTDAELREL
jgi:hypothetical protein